MERVSPVIIDLQGTDISTTECNLLAHPLVGGVILFRENFSSKQQIIQLVESIKSIKTLLVIVDHEGGTVWRFDSEFTKPPAMELYGNLYQHDSQLAMHEVKNAGMVIAGELLQVGIDLSFAPVVDLAWPESPIIAKRQRSFHINPQIVTTLAKEFISGMNAVGMQSVIKHFPGHGGSKQDSHFDLATDPRSLAELEQDLQPFAELADIATGVMPSHVIYPQGDSLPASCSNYWVTQVLRDRLNFPGVVISDCLTMQALDSLGDMNTRASLAFKAGCDAIIVSHQTRDNLSRFLDSFEFIYNQQQSLAKLYGDFSNPRLKQPLPTLAEISSAVV